MSIIEAPRPQRVRADAPRPQLRVVAPPRRRRTKALGALGLCLLFVVLFATAAFHVMLVQNQQKIDRLNRRADTAQARYDHLRLEVDELQAPSRIVSSARKLGMVEADDATWLTPKDSSGSGASENATPTTSDHYLVVKPFLGDAP